MLGQHPNRAAMAAGAERAAANAASRAAEATAGGAAERWYPWLVFALSFALLLSDSCRAGAQRGLPAAQGRMGAERRTAGRARRRGRADGGRAHLSLSILSVRPLGPRAQPGPDGGDAGGHAGLLRHQLRRDVHGAAVRRRRRAAYGSVGIAPRCCRSSRATCARQPERRLHRRRRLRLGALGMALGGLLSSHFGWRWAFAGMALFGPAVVALFRLCITESRVLAQRRRALGEEEAAAAPPAGPRCARCWPSSRRRPFSAYVGSAAAAGDERPAGLDSQLPVALLRHGDRSRGVTAAGFVLAGGTGMMPAAR